MTTESSTESAPRPGVVFSGQGLEPVLFDPRAVLAVQVDGKEVMVQVGVLTLRARQTTVAKARKEALRLAKAAGFDEAALAALKEGDVE
jgi:hypothetical protein